LILTHVITFFLLIQKEKERLNQQMNHIDNPSFGRENKKALFVYLNYAQKFNDSFHNMVCGRPITTCNDLSIKENHAFLKAREQLMPDVQLLLSDIAYVTKILLEKNPELPLNTAIHFVVSEKYAMKEKGISEILLKEIIKQLNPETITSVIFKQTKHKLDMSLKNCNSNTIECVQATLDKCTKEEKVLLKDALLKDPNFQKRILHDVEETLAPIAEQIKISDETELYRECAQNAWKKGSENTILRECANKEKELINVQMISPDSLQSHQQDLITIKQKELKDICTQIYPHLLPFHKQALQEAKQHRQALLSSMHEHLSTTSYKLQNLGFVSQYTCNCVIETQKSLQDDIDYNQDRYENPHALASHAYAFFCDKCVENRAATVFMEMLKQMDEDHILFPQDQSTEDAINYLEENKIIQKLPYEAFDDQPMYRIM